MGGAWVEEVVVRVEAGVINLDALQTSFLKADSWGEGKQHQRLSINNTRTTACLVPPLQRSTEGQTFNRLRSFIYREINKQKEIEKHLQ